MNHTLFPRRKPLRAAPTSLVLALALAYPLAQAQTEPTTANMDDLVLAINGETTTRNSGIVEIVGAQPTSLPTRIPTTIEGISGREVETKINATDSEDALKYFPSLLVRKRYIGDYNHAVLSSRASGTGNSARSVVFADGILLSNFLGNGAGFTPRWGLVTPEEIDRVDVLYGPFSAAYTGNSVGAIVDYVTRMPKEFEAHVKVGAFSQPFDIYSTHQTFGGWQTSASLGSRAGDFAWWINLNHLDSDGQPLTFPTKLLSSATTPTASVPGTAVSGAILDQDKSNNPWWVLGTATQYHTIQDHSKLKLSYDFSTTVRAAYTFGGWQNKAVGQSVSYLTTANGSPFYTGVANIGGKNYSLSASDFNQTQDELQQSMHALSVKSRTRGVFDWEFAASVYSYDKDLSRTATVAKPAADNGGAGRLTDGHGTGWNTLALKGVWRPGINGSGAAEHQVDFGFQQDSYQWRQVISNLADWINGSATTPVNSFVGNTRLQGLFGQDAWTINERWTAVLGARLEHWTAYGGAKTTAASPAVHFQDRSENYVSPKAALGWQAADEWTLKLSTGRAVRVPTVGELFQGNAGTDIVTNPNLKPEKSWTTELSTEWTRDDSRVRATLFHEKTADALYSQAIAGTTPIVNSTQNIDRLRTIGVETALNLDNLFSKAVDLAGSLTYADSKIVANSSYVTTPGDTIGKQQPRVPKWRASALATWRVTPALSASYGARFGSTQFGTLNNSDPNGFTYQGFSKYFTTDLRLRYQFDRQWSAAIGIDNLNNAKYWNFHPYPNRSYNVEVKFDL